GRRARRQAGRAGPDDAGRLRVREDAGREARGGPIARHDARWRHRTGSGDRDRSSRGFRGDLPVTIYNRWFQLCASLVAMIMIANLQYSWTLFVEPMRTATGWKLSDIQWAFTLFILF